MSDSVEVAKMHCIAKTDLQNPEALSVASYPIPGVVSHKDCRNSMSCRVQFQAVTYPIHQEGQVASGCPAYRNLLMDIAHPSLLRSMQGLWDRKFKVILLAGG